MMTRMSDLESTIAKLFAQVISQASPLRTRPNKKQRPPQSPDTMTVGLSKLSTNNLTEDDKSSSSSGSQAATASNGSHLKIILFLQA